MVFDMYFLLQSSPSFALCGNNVELVGRFGTEQDFGGGPYLNGWDEGLFPTCFAFVVVGLDHIDWPDPEGLVMPCLSLARSVWIRCFLFHLIGEYSEASEDWGRQPNQPWRSAQSQRAGRDGCCIPTLASLQYMVGWWC